MKEEVEQALRRGNAPAGYVVRDLEGEEGAEVEYPDSLEAMVGWTADQSTMYLSPNSILDQCNVVLQLEGYHTEVAPGPHHHCLIVRR
jgi:hypothetical protein